VAGHRRAALLTVLAAVAVAALLVPVLEHAIVPGPGDLGVGWSLLAGAVLASRRPWVAGCLALAGVLWVAVGLAPLGPAFLEDPVTRLALVPTALLVCAAAGLSPGRDRRLVLAASGLAVAMAAVGGAGAARTALVGIAVAALVVPVGTARRATATTAVQAAVGAGLALVGLEVAGVVDPPTDLAVAVQLLVLAGGALGVGWWAGSGVTLGARLGPEDPLELGRALGRALGTDDVTLVFPDGSGGWLDPAGRPSEPGDAAYDVTEASGRVLARSRPALVVERNLVPDLHRFLRAAGDGARLRAALRDRAGQVARSQDRLVTAAEDERRRLVSRLEAGPLLRLQRLTDTLGPPWVDRVQVARRTLDELVGGLDPVQAAGGLLPALARLADDVSGTFPGDLDPAVARTAWFVCAEALANARKHAPGAAVSVSLEVADELVLTVTDDGPGGADLGGAGLAGLGDRLAVVGGSLAVTTGPTGTTVIARVPLGDDVVPLMPAGRSLATVDP
jgi:signal transduction histidine kinase